MAGRPPMWDNAEAFAEAVNKYFEENPFGSVNGLAIHLGFKSRQSVFSYSKKHSYADILRKYIQKPNRRILGIKHITVNQYSKERYKKDPSTNIRIRIGSQIRYHLKKKNKGTFKNLPYSISELMTDLESKFTDGMSWENLDKWHIDHIKPVCSFDIKSVESEEFKKCWSLNNLQPLWAKDNLIKGSKML